MHPTDRRSLYYALGIFLLIFVIVVLANTKVFYFSFAILVFGIIIFASKLKKAQKFVFLASFSSADFGVLSISEYIKVKDSLESENDFFIVVMLFAFVISVSFYLIFLLLAFISDRAIHEKKYYTLIQNHPHLICKNHLTRVVLRKSLGYKEIACRVGEECVNQNQVIKLMNLVGRIGKPGHEQKDDESYYVDLWQPKTGEIKYGDYDIIEIYESNDIDDYDALISKIVSYLYNEIDRHKPINEVSVKVIGNPKLSENTKRLLEQNFLKVEYASNT